MIDRSPEVNGVPSPRYVRPAWWLHPLRWSSCSQACSRRRPRRPSRPTCGWSRAVRRPRCTAAGRVGCSWIWASTSRRSEGRSAWTRGARRTRDPIQTAQVISMSDGSTMSVPLARGTERRMARPAWLPSDHGQGRRRRPPRHTSDGLLSELLRRATDQRHGTAQPHVPVLLQLEPVHTRDGVGHRSRVGREHRRMVLAGPAPSRRHLPRDRARASAVRACVRHRARRCHPSDGRERCLRAPDVWDHVPEGKDERDGDQPDAVGADHHEPGSIHAARSSNAAGLRDLGPLEARTRLDLVRGRCLERRAGSAAGRRLSAAE